ncbi:WbuC family cupin fold metalloprotein [Solimonas soli]|uniref:WbuC family cupin fold metalloprotein n=1 Tax=Solimonas soli TaxID=413479 RepID=UPI0004AE3707|nr:WbuC family cupin fold metalloprotein [Solimonas soli]
MSTKLLSADALDALCAQARAAPRRRAHLNLHEDADAPVQRFAIAAEPDSYFRPHRHPAVWELLCVLRGRFLSLQFDDDGVLTQRAVVDARTPIIETPANTFHTVLALDGGSVFFEIKQGPYRPTPEQDFVAWAPAEGGDVAPLQRWLREAQPGQRYAG